MTINQLLEFWAEWSARKEDGGLGFKASRLSVLMSGGAVAGGGNSSLPYGVDENAVALAVDRAICRLSPRRREIVTVEYRSIGTQAAKAAGLKRAISLDAYKRILRNARWNLASDDDVKRLLKNY